MGRKAVPRQQLKEIKRKSEDVLAYISRAEVIRSELRDACNEDLPDEAFMHYVLDGLGNAYRTFVRHVRYANEVLSLEDLKTRLLNVEMTVKHDDGYAEDTTQAYHVTHRVYNANRTVNKQPAQIHNPNVRVHDQFHRGGVNNSRYNGIVRGLALS